MLCSSEQERAEWIEALTEQNLMSFEEETDSSLTWGEFSPSRFPGDFQAKETNIKA